MVNRQFYINKLKSMATTLRKHYGVLKLVLYGTVARDCNHSDSDFDLCVVTATPNPFLLVDLSEHLAATVGCTVDIVRMQPDINPYLLSQIQKDGIRIF